MNTVMSTLLWMLIPLVLIPLVMRFVAVRLLLRLARQRLLPRRLKEMEAGWAAEDRELLEAAEGIVRKRLSTLLPPRYDIAADTREILLAIQRKRGDEAEELSFSFSIRSAAEVGLLAFADLYGDLHRRSFFRLLQRTRLKWLLRAQKLAEMYAEIVNLPLVRQLNSGRALGLLVRLTLIPLIGLPFLLVYLLRSITIGIAVDGSFRYLYALGLLRITYYGIYLYGGTNSRIASRISRLRKAEIIAAGRVLEEELQPSAWGAKSLHYAEGAARLTALLRELGIDEDHRVQRDFPGSARRSLLHRRLFRRLRDSALLAARRGLHQKADGRSIAQGLRLLVEGISGVYVPQGRRFHTQLRLGELIAAGYFASLLLLARLYAAPGVRSALGKVSLEFAISLNALSEDELFRTLVSGAREGVRLAGFAARVRRATKVLRGRYHPAGLALSFAGPFALAHLENSLKTGLYHRAGRLILYIWEQNARNRVPPVDEYLIDSLR